MPRPHVTVTAKCTALDSELDFACSSLLGLPANSIVQLFEGPEGVKWKLQCLPFMASDRSRSPSLITIIIIIITLLTCHSTLA